jgi:mRNA-degrading endonuclease RelE of RelBE toxin-antitoxin system
MKKILYARRFKKDYKRLPENIKEAFKKQLSLFFTNPRHPSLDIKKMQDPRNIWRGKITEGYRFTFQMEENCYIFRRIGPHDIEREP